jgi:hypothetical protein
MEERPQNTSETIISRLKELDSERRRLYKEMKALPKPPEPSKEADQAVKMELNRLKSVYGRQLKQAIALYQQANDRYNEQIVKANRNGIAVVYVEPDVEESSLTTEVQQVSSSEVSGLPSVLSTEPASEVQSDKQKPKLGLNKKTVIAKFKEDFGKLVGALRQLKREPANADFKLSVETNYKVYLASKKIFIESFRSDAEQLIKSLRKDKADQMGLVDDYEAKLDGGNSEENKQKYMKYKLKYMKLKELLGL